MLGKTGRLVLALSAIAVILPAQGRAQDFSGTHLAGTSLSFPMPPFRYEGSRVVSVGFRTSPEVLRALVPEPLVPNPAGQASALIVHHHIVAPMPLSYYEAFLAVPVSHEGAAGVYIPVLYLDEAAAITGGREIWGFSKFGAEIQIVEEEGRVQASVRTGGVTLIDMSVRTGDTLEPIPETPNAPIFNVKLIPSVEKSAPPDVLQLTATTLGDRKFTELRPGVGRLEFGSTPIDPLGSIPILEILEAACYEDNFILDYGEVVHDYLAQGG
ncbi:MAG: acetoacetate decarboxylase family protein [Gemmatimonadales bacterium]|jgi:acetoacetate decarboxylase